MIFHEYSPGVQDQAGRRGDDDAGAKQAGSGDVNTGGALCTRAEQRDEDTDAAGITRPRDPGSGNRRPVADYRLAIAAKRTVLPFTAPFLMMLHSSLLLIM